MTNEEFIKLSKEIIVEFINNRLHDTFKGVPSTPDNILCGSISRDSNGIHATFESISTPTFIYQVNSKEHNLVLYIFKQNIKVIIHNTPVIYYNHISLKFVDVVYHRL